MPDGSQDSGPRLLGVCLASYEDPYMELYRRELRKYLLEEKGMKEDDILVAYAADDPEKQSRQLEELLGCGVDAVILDAVNEDCIPAAVDRCAQAQVPVVCVGQEPEPDDNPELSRWKRFFRQRKNVRDLVEWDPQQTPIPKVTFMVWENSQIERMEEELKNDFYIALFQTVSGKLYNGELISLKDNKGTAIRKAAEFLNVDFRNTVAFGDSMNDYQMIETAAQGIAMGNADEKIKKIADRICESVEEDGVIRELERMGII